MNLEPVQQLETPYSGICAGLEFLRAQNFEPVQELEDVHEINALPCQNSSPLVAGICLGD